jgi:hypothetical protein
MTRKDYELIAAGLKDCTPVLLHELIVWETVVEAMAYTLSKDNARFNFATFYKACGMEVV